MPKYRVLITVTAYPLPSRSYDELVCTAGVLEDGSWIRIYPVPLNFLMGIRDNEKAKTFKYNWVEIDLKRRKGDLRPESYSPIKYDFSDIRILEHIGTDNNWHDRKKFCLRKVYTNLEALINDSKEPKNLSLAVFKPSKIIDFYWVEDTREWKDEWVELRKQIDLFGSANAKSTEIKIRKLPYKFYYKFIDDTGKESNLLIEDWEIGSLYWKCLKDAKNDELLTLMKVRNKFFDEFALKKDIYFFLGTTLQWHLKRAPNPFVIVGVFYPPIALQGSLF